AIEQRRDRDRINSVEGLRDDAITDYPQRCPFLIGEEAVRGRIDAEPFGDDAAGDVVPRGRIALGEHVIAWIEVTHPSPPRARKGRQGPRAPAPRSSAAPAKAVR